MSLVTTAPTRPAAPDRGTSVGKALALLDAFPDDGRWIGVTELARRADVAKASAFRLLALLEEDAYVERDGANYCLGRRVFELGNRIRLCRPGGLRDAALPYLTEIYERTQRTVHLAVLDGCHVMYLEKMERRGVRTPTRVGGRALASCTALGKAQLAFGPETSFEHVVRSGLKRLTPYTLATPSALQRDLEQVRADGVAFDREETAIGLWCVAAPILDGARRPIGALSVSGPPFEAPGSLTMLVQQAAASVSRLVRG